MDYKELIALSQKAADEWRNDHTFYQAGILIDSLCSAIENFLAEQNATNVAPVVHGRWEIGCRFCPICGIDKFSGLNADIYEDWQPKYCPNCGAKMD